MSKLKPCPFCGGEARIISEYDTPLAAHRHWQLVKSNLVRSLAETETDEKVKSGLFRVYNKIYNDYCNNIITEDYMSNPVPAIAVAQVFLDLAAASGQRLSNMQLQKLVYFAHGIHLAVFNTPLIEDPVKAWDFGPVIPSLYEKLRIFGRGFVRTDLAPETRDHINPQSNEAKAISSAWNTYKDYDAWQLSAIIHIANSPWDKIWNQNNNHYGQIPNHLIAEYYQQRIKRS